MTKRELADQIFSVLDKSNMNLEDIQDTLEWVQNEIIVRTKCYIKSQKYNTLPKPGSSDFGYDYECFYEGLEKNDDYDD